jgi:GWxTD domain-containing protein
MRKVLAYCSLLVACALGLLYLSQSGATAQDSSGKKAQSKQAQSSTPAKPETVAKPKTDKQIKKDEQKLKKELETPYKKWLNEEVLYIISDEERKAFGRLNTDEERENFIEQFWLRRDPTPDTPENEYEEEHYRRIAYANETFASGIPGWKTDRGMIYIKFGPPDERDEHSSGGLYERPIEEGGGQTSTFPFEKWRYRYIEGMGNDVNIEFVDTTMTGEYHMTADPSEKDALLYVPGAGLTMYEQMGLICKTDRFTRTDGTHLGTGSMPLPASMDQFTRLEQITNLEKPPVTKFKDLDAIVSTSVKYNLLPMQVRADYIPVTDAQVLTNITIQFDRKDFQYKDKQGISSASIEVTGRISTISRRYVTSFDEAVQPDPVPTEMLEQAAHGPDIFQHIIPLKPGLYRLDVAAKDVNSGNTSVITKKLEVPRLDEDRLSSSSLILADTLEKVDIRSIGKDPFVIGNNKVRPRMDGADGRPNFKRDEKMGIYLQLYNFEPDMVSNPDGSTKLSEKKADGVVTTEVLKNVPGTPDQVVGRQDEEVSDIIKANRGSSFEVPVEKYLPLTGFAPGQYTIKITVMDRKRNQTVTQSAPFTVD